MRATIIVKDRRTDSIVKLAEASSLDEVTVGEVVRSLEKQYPPSGYRIDTSQVRLARQALAAA
jgi:hypothetical protein